MASKSAFNNLECLVPWFEEKSSSMGNVKTGWTGPGRVVNRAHPLVSGGDRHTTSSRPEREVLTSGGGGCFAPVVIPWEIIRRRDLDVPVRSSRSRSVSERQVPELRPLQ